MDGGGDGEVDSTPESLPLSFGCLSHDDDDVDVDEDDLLLVVTFLQIACRLPDAGFAKLPLQFGQQPSTEMGSIGSLSELELDWSVDIVFGLQRLVVPNLSLHFHLSHRLNSIRWTLFFSTSTKASVIDESNLPATSEQTRTEESEEGRAFKILFGRGLNKINFHSEANFHSKRVA